MAAKVQCPPRPEKWPPNSRLSLEIPVFLQDERVTSYEARKRLWDRGILPRETKQFVDSEAAAIILTDFIERLHQIITISRLFRRQYRHIGRCLFDRLLAERNAGGVSLSHTQTGP